MGTYVMKCTKCQRKTDYDYTAYYDSILNEAEEKGIRIPDFLKRKNNLDV